VTRGAGRWCAGGAQQVRQSVEDIRDQRPFRRGGPHRPGRQRQQQRPRGADREPGQRHPRTDHSGLVRAEYELHQQLQAGQRRDVAGRADHRGHHGGQHDQHAGPPAVLTGQVAEEETRWHRPARRNRCAASDPGTVPRMAVTVPHSAPMDTSAPKAMCPTDSPTAIGAATAAAARAARFQSTGARVGLSSWVSQCGAGHVGQRILRPGNGSRPDLGSGRFGICRRSRAHAPNLVRRPGTHPVRRPCDGAATAGIRHRRRSAQRRAPPGAARGSR